jgi:D-alanyl-D-alanine carboxypeptidase (penicillin-binding protein 5/6)
VPGQPDQSPASAPGDGGDSRELSSGTGPDPAAGPAVPLPAAPVQDITASAPAIVTPPDGPATARPDGAVAPRPEATPRVPPVPLPTPGADAVGPPATRRERRSHRHRRWWPWVVALVVLVVLVAGVGAAVRITRPLHQPAAASALPAALTVAGTSPSLPWPADGQAAVAVPSLGFTAQSGPESSVPIASLTKMTTALVVLTDHPIAPGAGGPSITITAQDIAEYDNELANDESTVRIELGEVLTERQALEGMLSQSANDLAYSLAVWDAGSLPAFVAKMNATAVRLRATDTHYVDASGYEPQTVSSASDVIRVASAAMAIPTFAQVVAMSSVTLPVVGTIANIEPEIGSTVGGDTVVGIKSGYTSEAKGCLVLAVNREIDGRSVLVLTAVLGQPVPAAVVPTTTTTTVKAGAPASTAPASTAPSTTTTTIPADDLEVPDPLRYTRPVTAALLAATAAAVVSTAVARAGQPAGTVTATWGGTTHRVGVVATSGASLAGWPGQQIRVVTTLSPVPPGAAAGRRVGTATYALGAQSESVPLRLAATVPEPSWWWRLVHD